MTFTDFRKIVLEYFRKKYEIKKRKIKKMILFDIDICGEYIAKFTTIKSEKTVNFTLEYSDIRKVDKWILVYKDKNVICNLAPTIEECCDFIKNKGYDLCKN